MGVQGISFRVTGEAITDRARDLLLSERLMDALKFLGDSLVGISMEQCFSILNGSAKLVTLEDGVNLVEDDDPAHRAELQDRYGMRMRIAGHWHEPYAIIMDTGVKDRDAWYSLKGTTAAVTAAESGQTSGFFRRFREETETIREAVRVAFYADDPKTDRILYVGGEARFQWPELDLHRSPLAVILRRCEEPLPGVRTARNVHEAVEKASIAKTLKITGHRIAYPPVPEDEGDIKPAAEPRKAPTLSEEEKEALALAREREAAERAAFKDLCSRIGASVRERAGPQDGDGWMDLVAGERTMRIPRLAFEGWALSRAGARALAEWSPVADVGLKLYGDDPYHSDWMLGAGLPLDAMYRTWGQDADEELVEAAYDAMARIQHERLRKENTVLAGSGRAVGPAYVASRDRKDGPRAGSIVVLPDASPDWLETVQGAAAVIVAQGGALAHLVTVLRPGGVPVIRLPRAHKVIPEGVQVDLDCAAGSVTIGRPQPAPEAPGLK